MILAAAQTIPTQADISQNLRDHLRLAQHAARHKAQCIIFPELSLTGYVLEDAHRLAFREEDARLEELHGVAKEHDITIVAGAPFFYKDTLYLASFALLPDGKAEIYTKQFLHGGEKKFYTAGKEANPLLRLGNERCSLAICADITHPEHPANAASVKSTLYAASIFYTPGGINEGHSSLQEYALRHSMHILMANYGGVSYNFQSGGRSAFWCKSGELIAELPSSGEGLLVVEGSGDQWRATIMDAESLD